MSRPDDDIPIPPARPWDQREKIRSTPGSRQRDEEDLEEEMPLARRRSPDREPRRDERPPPVKSSSTNAGWIILVIGGGVVALTLGGFCVAATLIYYSVSNAVQSISTRPVGFGPFAVIPPPSSVAEALAYLQMNDPEYRRAAATWLATQPIDPAQQRTVALALDPLISDSNPAVSESGMKALAVWATVDNVPSLLAAVTYPAPVGIFSTYNVKQNAMFTLGRLKDPRAVPVLVKELGSLLDRSSAARALRDFGPTAESELLKSANHPQEPIRTEVRALLATYKTREELLIDQALADLRGADRGRHPFAADTLAHVALDPKKQADVSKALNACLANSASCTAALDALNVWLTADNVPALMQVADDSGRAAAQRSQALELLIKLDDARAYPALAAAAARGDLTALTGLEKCGPKAEKAVLKYFNQPNASPQIRELLKGYQTKPATLITQCITDLEGDDDGKKSVAVKYLADAPVDETLRPKVSKALLPQAANVTVFARDNDPIVKSITRWATKDSIPALLTIGAHSWPGVSDPAWDALADLKDESVADKMAEMWQKAHVGQRAKWRTRLARMGKVAEPAVRKHLNDADEFRWLEGVCELLGEIGNKESVAALQTVQEKAVGPFKESTKKAAAAAIAEIGKREK